MKRLKKARDKAERELEAWKDKKKVKVQPHPPKMQPQTTKPSQKGDAIWKADKKSQSAPPPRKSGSIEVRFTPRAFPTAARESKVHEEEEWLTKQAAARRITTDETTNSNSNINERNPEFLKDKGVEFFRNGNFEAAINAFSEAIKLNPNLPQLFSNRAACYLATSDSDRCINDCTRALELFYPVVPSNYLSRSKVFVRRGTAFAKEGEYKLAVQDYEAAAKLVPDDEYLREDCARLRLVCEDSSR